MKNQGRCKLCLNSNVKLRYSHILPEFLYTGVYDAKHRMIFVDPRPQEKDDVLQKGLREHLMCGPCEGRLAELERYAAKVLRNLPSTDSYSPGHIVLQRSIDYKQFKLFEMSLLWRCSIASGPAFAALDLGPHEEKVRRMLVEENPGKPWEYGCFIAALRKPGSVKGMVKFPGQLRIEGHRGYHLVVWGLLWFFVVSSHAARLSGKDSFLSGRGDLPIHVSDETAEAFFADVARELTKAGKKL